MRNVLYSLHMRLLKAKFSADERSTSIVSLPRSETRIWRSIGPRPKLERSLPLKITSHNYEICQV